jgi:hypothetical protein
VRNQETPPNTPRAYPCSLSQRDRPCQLGFYPLLFFVGAFFESERQLAWWALHEGDSTQLQSRVGTWEHGNMGTGGAFAV